MFWKDASRGGFFNSHIINFFGWLKYNKTSFPLTNFLEKHKSAFFNMALHIYRDYTIYIILYHLFYYNMSNNAYVSETTFVLLILLFM